jgi:hypothetical protein
MDEGEVIRYDLIPHHTTPCHTMPPRYYYTTRRLVNSIEIIENRIIEKKKKEILNPTNTTHTASSVHIKTCYTYEDMSGSGLVWSGAIPLLYCPVN